MDNWAHVLFALILALLPLLGGAVLTSIALLRRVNHAGRVITRLRTELRDAHAENKVMEMIARNASDGLVLQNERGIIEWSNPAYSRMTGYSAEELRGRCPLELVVPLEDRPSPKEIAAYRYDFTSGALDKFEVIRNIRKNGEYFWNQLGFAVVNYDDTTERKVIVIARDVTEQIEREDALRRAKEDQQKRAETDALTGLPNRMKLDAFLAEALGRADTNHSEVGIIHVDLDQFKEVNDTLGHAAGDAVLVFAAEVLRRHTGDADLACRFGGDEFILVCTQAQDAAELEALARRVLADLKEPMSWEGKRISTRASIGITLSRPHARDPQVLMRQADMALYEIKNSGRNDVMVFSDALGELVLKRTEISSALSNGIANDELGVVLQPQFDLARRRVTGFEALIRWHHPRRGLLRPADFLSVAEQNGQMEQIDRVAIRGALDALRTLRDAGYPDLRMSINVSARMLNQDTYIDELKWEVEKRNLRPEDIAVEVLETILIEGRDNQEARSIAALYDAGFAVELDDFGSGYSGLVNLARLKIQGVKIDQALVQNLVSDPTTQTVLKAIFRLCGDLGLSVIAEGVEERKQAAIIELFGGRIVQGYGVARPMSLDQALTWLATADMNAVLAPKYRRQELKRQA